MRARSGYFQNHTALGKPKRRVEDDEDVIEKVPYLYPVAGLATGCRWGKVTFPCHQPSDRDALCFFADAKIQGSKRAALQFDAEFSNPNPGSEALHGGQARPDAHGFASRTHG